MLGTLPAFAVVMYRYTWEDNIKVGRRDVDCVEIWIGMNWLKVKFCDELL